MEDLYIQIQSYLNIPYLIAFVLLSYGLKNITAWIICKAVPNCKDPKTYGVFIIATLLAIPFWFYDDPLRLLITYAVGTSMYDLIIDSLVSRIKSFLNPKKTE